jgi:hypothetical protein
MGETADQTRKEIVALRAEMSSKVVELRQAAERPIRIAKTVAIGAVALVVVGGVALVVIGARRRAERRSLRGQLRSATKAAINPQKTAKKAKAAVDQVRAKLREELREELKKELKDQRPLHERVLSTAVKSAATAAVPIVLKQLESRAWFRDGAGGGKSRPGRA